MNRLAASTLFAVATWSVSGCGPTDIAPPYATGPSSGEPDCSEVTSCAACTPVVGCGWCSRPDGTGWCGSDPGRCVTQWTWEPNFCAAASDAATSASLDAAPAQTTSDSGSADAARAASDGGQDASDGGGADVDQAADASADSAWDGSDADATDVDANPSTASVPPIVADGGGCAANDGGSCSANQPYGLTCTIAGSGSAVPEPPPSLECSVAETQVPAGTLDYCCSYAPAASAFSLPR